jgi:hypothetical protein
VLEGCPWELAVTAANGEAKKFTAAHLVEFTSALVIFPSSL